MRGFGTRNRAKQWARFALKCGLLLTDAKLWASINEQLKEHTADITDEVHSRYEDAVGRVQGARRALRGDNNWVGPVMSFIVGIGVGVGMLMAPASGEETRSAIRDKAVDIKNDIKNKVSDMGAGTARFRSSATSAPATGTEGY
jgi:hypothetical protein